MLLAYNAFSQVTDTGNKVGIGTISPEAKLHTYESTGLGTTLGNFQVLSRISGSGTQNTIMENNWLLRDENGNSWHTTRFHNGISVDLSFLTPGVDTRTWWERDSLAGNQFWGNSSVTQMALSGSNLGIGTVSPDEKLHVNGTATINGDIGVANLSHWKTGSHTLELQNRDAGDVVLSFHREGYTHAAIKHSSLGGLVFSGSGEPNQNHMFLHNNGYLGIGTITPDSKLSVNGNIHTKEVKVDLIGWSDFVFAKDYDLPTLKEVEQHIKEKGHLKDIPSTEDVKENGIFLGEMDSKLLQKIEELTLYTIEQEKSLKEQNSKIKKQEEEITKLKSIKTYRIASSTRKIRIKRLKKTAFNNL